MAYLQMSVISCNLLLSFWTIRLDSGTSGKFINIIIPVKTQIIDNQIGAFGPKY